MTNKKFLNNSTQTIPVEQNRLEEMQTDEPVFTPKTYPQQGIVQSAIQAAQQKQQLPQLTTDELFNQYQGLSPEQQAAYEAKYATNPNSENPFLDYSRFTTTSQDWYPTLSQPIAVGHYGGRMIGNTTQYAPSGFLLPMAAIDKQRLLNEAKEEQRGLNIRKSALQKAKDIEEFKKSIKPPNTEMQNLNPKMNELFFKQYQDRFSKAVKDNGGDEAKAVYALRNDPTFNKWLQDWNNTAAAHTQNYKHIQEIQKDITDKKMWVNPQIREKINELLTQTDPIKFDTGFRNITASLNIDQSFNDAVKEIKPQVTPSQEGELLYQTETYTPQEIQSVAETMTKGNNGLTYDENYKIAQARLQSKTTAKEMSESGKGAATIDTKLLLKTPQVVAFNVNKDGEMKEETSVIGAGSLPTSGKTNDVTISKNVNIFDYSKGEPLKGNEISDYKIQDGYEIRAIDGDGNPISDEKSGKISKDKIRYSAFVVGYRTEQVEKKYGVKTGSFETETGSTPKKERRETDKVLIPISAVKNTFTNKNTKNVELLDEKRSKSYLAAKAKGAKTIDDLKPKTLGDWYDYNKENHQEIREVNTPQAQKQKVEAGTAFTPIYTRTNIKAELKKQLNREPSLEEINDIFYSEDNRKK